MFHRMMNYGEAEARPSVLITRDLIKRFIPKYKRHDDLIIIQESAWEEFKKSMPLAVVKCENSPFSIDEDELASLLCQSIASKQPTRRVAIERGAGKSDCFRSPDISILLGENGLVTHTDNKITYQFDVTKCMFSFANVREKIRMAELDCSNEEVVDLFAGIGYFTLPLLVHAKAKHLYACEWNSNAIEALKHNLTLNNVEAQRYTVIEGDNRLNRPANVAQRVILGILPSCMDWMSTALECVNQRTGAILHCHELVESKPSANSKHTNSLTESKNSDYFSITGADRIRSSLDSQSLMASSNSSHSTIEKISTHPNEDSRPLLLQSSESSDKSTCSPVMLERPSSNSTVNVSSNSSSFFDPTANNNSDSREQLSLTSSTSSQNDGSIIEPPILADNEISAYEARGFALIEKIRDKLEAANLTARLLQIQPVKSYAPHVNHVVFDIKIEPSTQSNGNK